MKRFVKFLLPIAMMLFTAGSCFAEGLFNASSEQRMAATLKLGLFFPAAENSKHDIQNSGFELAFRYSPLAFVSTEASVGYYQVKGSGESMILNSIPVTTTLKAVAPFYWGNVYAGGGVGLYNMWMNKSLENGLGSSEDHSLGFHMGGGIELFLGRAEMVILDYKHIEIASEDTKKHLSGNGEMVSVGFGYRF